MGGIIGCGSPQYNFINDSSGKTCLTYFNISDSDSDLKSYPIITHGRWESKQLPRSYLKGRNTWSDGWECLIKCNGDTITVYDPYNYFDQINRNSSSIKYEKMKDQQFYKIFYDSTTEEYIKLSSEHR